MLFWDGIASRSPGSSPALASEFATRCASAAASAYVSLRSP